MNITQIESNIESLIANFNEESFIYDFLIAFGTPNATIKKLQIGTLNLSKKEDEVLWKKKLYFTRIVSNSLHSFIDSVRKDETINKQQPRFIIVINDKSLVAYDTKTSDSLDCELKDLPKHFSFFLPIAGMEKAQLQVENPADVKASEKMAKLYDEIRKDNQFDTEEEVHGLNVFLSRLLFCFFAEDTGIFETSQFTHSISNHTQTDGSDLDTYLDRVFEIMNIPKETRVSIPQFLNDFPYVNGGLFKDFHKAPQFTRRSRQVILECGELSWSEINPDIFGSMIQAVITPEHRGGMGMHYTSVPNIMKVIEPLFINDFYKEFETSKGNPKKLRLLLNRLWSTKYFDPACGSGNFLIITYKELRKLEMKIFKELNEMAFSNISLNQFYGIELDDFAHEVAILSLWLAEHQMNQIFYNEFGRSKPSLPLTSSGNIIHGNACRLDWEEVCPKVHGSEIFIFGNPPYLGTKMQSKEQKLDMALVFAGNENYKKLDLIAAWFLKGAKYMSNENCRLAFVSTSSVCQGEMVELIWPLIFEMGVFINFAYCPFKWSNNAKSTAGVTVVVIGLSKNRNDSKFLFNGDLQKNVESINPYLNEGNTIIISKRPKPLSFIPNMLKGSIAYDDGNLLLNEDEKNHFLNENPHLQKFIKKIIGSNEFINGITKYCLWINDKDLNEVINNEFIIKRLEKVTESRKKSPNKGISSFQDRPHKFVYITYSETASLIVPSVSSEKRIYIPIGFLDYNCIVSNAAYVIYNPEPYLFGILSSKIHNAWVKSVGGRLDSRIRYSSNLCYNTFPIPDITMEQKQIVELYSFNVIQERENHSEKTLAQLYDPDKMPEGLREAHRQLDLAVESCYRLKPFDSDEERLEYLFKLYEQMITKEKEQGTLFESTKKTKK